MRRIERVCTYSKISYFTSPPNENVLHPRPEKQSSEVKFRIMIFFEREMLREQDQIHGKKT